MKREGRSNADDRVEAERETVAGDDVVLRRRHHGKEERRQAHQKGQRKGSGGFRIGPGFDRPQNCNGGAGCRDERRRLGADRDGHGSREPGEKMTRHTPRDGSRRPAAIVATKRAGHCDDRSPPARSDWPSRRRPSQKQRDVHGDIVTHAAGRHRHGCHQRQDQQSGQTRRARASAFSIVRT